MRKRRGKRWLSLVLSVAMMASLGACGGTGGMDETADDVGAGAQENTVGETAGGNDSGTMRTVSILCKESPTAGLYMENIEENIWWQELVADLAERNIELDLEVIQADQYPTTLQTRFSSGQELPDMVVLGRDAAEGVDDATALRWGKQGLLLDLNEVLGEHGGDEALAFLDEYAPYVEKRVTTNDGKMYWLPNLTLKTYNGEPASNYLAVNIRKDWLEAVGMDIPTTTEEFYEAVKAFREEDVNGSGVADEIVSVDPTNWDNGIAQWFGLGQALVSYITTTDEVVSPWYQDGCKEYFQYLNKMYNDGLLDSQLFGGNTDLETQLIVENKVSSTFSWILEGWLEPQVTGTENAYYYPIMALQNDAGTTPLYECEEPEKSYGKWAVTKDCDDLEAVAELFNYLYSTEYEELQTWGGEGVSYDTSNGYKAFIGKYADGSEIPDSERLLNDYIGTTLFPRIKMVDIQSEFVTSDEAKAEIEIDTIGATPNVAHMINNYQVLPDEEQTETINGIMSDLETYADELAVGLVIGTKSLDDWDTYMADLKELGLDELIEINRDLCDKYNAE